MTSIVLQDVTKVFGAQPARALTLMGSGWSKARIREETGITVALNRVSLTIDAAEIFVVMGLSGSGKSTLVRLINRLIAPTEGEVSVDGRSVTGFRGRELRHFRRHVAAMVFQNFALFPHMRVSDNIAYGLRIRGAGRRNAREKTEQCIEAVGLVGYESAFPHELSGGMQQRVGLARALATEPQILLMDEPFSALDPVTRRDMQDLLMGLQKDLKKTVVFITHDLHEALRLGSRIAILNDGTVVQQGSPRQIINHPANDHVRTFIRALPSLDRFT